MEERLLTSKGLCCLTPSSCSIMIDHSQFQSCSRLSYKEGALIIYFTHFMGVGVGVILHLYIGKKIYSMIDSVTGSGASWNRLLSTKVCPLSHQHWGASSKVQVLWKHASAFLMYVGDLQISQNILFSPKFSNFIERAMKVMKALEFFYQVIQMKRDFFWCYISVLSFLPKYVNMTWWQHHEGHSIQFAGLKISKTTLRNEFQTVNADSNILLV